MDSIQNNTEKTDMLEKVERVVLINGLEYEVSGNVLNLNLGRAGGKVKIKYDYATNSYVYNCNEYAIGFSSLIFFVLSFNTLYQVDHQAWSGYVAGLMFAGAIFNLIQLVLSHVQMLDIKAQLREVGIYLKSGA
ncbi:hypothetical protein [Vibrio atlanticus]|uniref:hypothetical protein n=1 Tax=Vibrio atlanticus TaxID=693153 RepID=UPI0022AF0C02|nr:hypothetical protein [Vibrio atlanticus]MCZ4310386.1 hypothetical protein [Vibrio atlanticus]